jgi:hypothetical protein
MTLRAPFTLALRSFQSFGGWAHESPPFPPGLLCRMDEPPPRSRHRISRGFPSKVVLSDIEQFSRVPGLCRMHAQAADFAKTG